MAMSRAIIALILLACAVFAPPAVAQSVYGNYKSTTFGDEYPVFIELAPGPAGRIHGIASENGRASGQSGAWTQSFGTQAQAAISGNVLVITLQSGSVYNLTLYPNGELRGSYTPGPGSRSMARTDLLFKRA